MPFPEHFGNVVQDKAPALQKYQVMEQKIGRLVFEIAKLAMAGFEDEFYGFFAYLLRNFLCAFAEEACRV